MREEGSGHQKRYWIARNRPVMADNGEGTDMNATKNNRISITPLHLNLSHQEVLPRVEALLAGVPEALLWVRGKAVGDRMVQVKAVVRFALQEDQIGVLSIILAPNSR